MCCSIALAADLGVKYPRLSHIRWAVSLGYLSIMSSEHAGAFFPVFVAVLFAVSLAFVVISLQKRGAAPVWEGGPPLIFYLPPACPGRVSPARFLFLAGPPVCLLRLLAPPGQLLGEFHDLRPYVMLEGRLEPPGPPRAPLPSGLHRGQGLLTVTSAGI